MADPRVDADTAGMTLLELAEAFGATTEYDAGKPNPFERWSENVGGKIEVRDATLLSIAMEGRLYLQDGKAVYKFRQPIELVNASKDIVSTISLKEPSAADFLAYSKGMTVTVSREGATEIDMVMMGKRTIRAMSRLSGQPEGVIERMSRRDLDDLTKVGDALGFFD